MQTDDNQQQDNQSPIHDFERITQDLRSALSRFQEDKTPESFAVIVSSLSTFGLTGFGAWKQVADYARSHPMRVAFGASLLYLAFKGMTREHARLSGSTLH